MTTPITLEAIGLERWQQLYELDPADVIERMDKARAPLHAGDAFLAVLQLRAIADTTRSVDALDAGTKTLNRATVFLVVLGIASLAVSIVALIVAINNG